MNTITANKRTIFTKSETKRIRNNNNIPAAIYGLNSPNQNIILNKGEVNTKIKELGENGIFDINLEGKNEKVMFKSFQRNPISMDIIHLDLQRIDETSRVHVKVPVVLKGEDKLKSLGAVAQIQLDEIDIECLTNSIPKYISADVSNVPVGDCLTVNDIEFSEEISIINPKNSIIVAVRFIKEKSVFAELEETAEK